MTEDYYNNLKKLLDIAKEKGVVEEEKFQELLENPVILDEILKT
jgi:hypothetical protein